MAFRNGARGPRLLEEILRWGTEQLFDTSNSHDHHARDIKAAAQLDGGKQDPPKREADSESKPTGMEVDGTGAAADNAGHSGNAAAPGSSQEGQKHEDEDRPNEAAAYTDEALDALIRWSTDAGSDEAGAGASEAAENAGMSEQGSNDENGPTAMLGPVNLSAKGLEDVTVREWTPMDASFYNSTGEEDDLEEEDTWEDVDASRSESAATAATYWDTLLRDHWQQLEKEEGGLHGRFESSAQSYGEDGEEGTLEAAAAGLGSERGSEEAPSTRTRVPSRRNELGKRERRKRRMDDADEDDLNSLDEPSEGGKKRRRGGEPQQLPNCSSSF